MPATSQAQQRTAAIALAAKEKHNTKGIKSPAKAMSHMSKAELEKYAHTKLKGLPKHVQKESVVGTHPVDTIEFWVVQKPTSHESSIQDIVTSCDPFQFVDMCRSGLAPDAVHGFYTEEEDAEKAGKQLLTDMYHSAKSLEEKKEEVTTKLQKTIDKLQKKAEEHMRMVKKEPDQADHHHEEAEKIMARIKELRGKHKMVETAKKQLKPLEEDK